MKQHQSAVRQPLFRQRAVVTVAAGLVTFFAISITLPGSVQAASSANPQSHATPVPGSATPLDDSQLTSQVSLTVSDGRQNNKPPFAMGWWFVALLISYVLYRLTRQLEDD
jgi:TRAP-type C4-dicarboxylate transport system permease small subunit